MTGLSNPPVQLMLAYASVVGLLAGVLIVVCIVLAILSELKR